MMEIPKKSIEHKLLPRLKILAFVLIFFGLGVLIYGLATSAASLVEPAHLTAKEETEASAQQLTAAPELKREIVYLGVSAFWAVGISLLIYAWRRRVKMKSMVE
jgi:hypothetical protein